MSRFKSMFAALVMAAIALTPQAFAAGPTYKAVISGSSAMFQTIALAAFKFNGTSGACVTGGTAPCFHWTGSGFNLTDTRTKAVTGSSTVDAGNKIWIVWDSSTASTGPNVWIYLTTDSVVGQRCYFAQPRCNINISSFPGSPAQLIGASLWGNDSASSAVPAAVVTALTSANGLLVSAAATDIRPEDGEFATCRANSQLDASGDTGLGYNSNNLAGVCPTSSGGTGDPNYIGSDIKSGYPGSTSAFHVLAYNISGTDPFSGKAIPAASTVSVGAAPIVVITERTAQLAGVKNITESQLHTVFGGSNCDGSALNGGTAGGIAVYNREPLSGTFNTFETTVNWYPRSHAGVSIEHGVAATNPMVALPCGTGARWRAIGTGEEVKSVLNSQSNNSKDGIGFTFFSFGNVSSIANSANYGYLTLNGVDPIFQVYGTTIDPVQPAIAGALPAAANLPASCSGTFPCSEVVMWANKLSFPNLRSGSYRAWSTLRMVSDGIVLANIKLLATGSNTVAATITPDYVPFGAVGTTDPGLLLVRAHYQQKDASGTNIGAGPVNYNAATGDKGGDVGGCIIPGNKNLVPVSVIQNDPDAGPGCVTIANP